MLVSCIENPDVGSSSGGISELDNIHKVAELLISVEESWSRITWKFMPLRPGEEARRCAVNMCSSRRWGF